MALGDEGKGRLQMGGVGVSVCCWFWFFIITSSGMIFPSFTTSRILLRDVGGMDSSSSVLLETSAFSVNLGSGGCGRWFVGLYEMVTWTISSIKT